MAIDIGTETVQVTKERVTWRFQGDVYDGDGSRIADPTIEVFRALKKRFGDEVVFQPDQAPLTVQASQLAALAEFAEIPPELTGLIRDRAMIPHLFRAMPLLVMMICDALEISKKLAEARQAEV